MIDKDEIFRPVMFHIRWYKLYNIAVHEEYAETNMKNTRNIMMKLSRHIRENQYNFDGKYEGIDINKSGVLDSLNDCSPHMKEDRVEYLKEEFLISKSNPIVRGGFTEDDF